MFSKTSPSDHWFDSSIKVENFEHSVRWQLNSRPAIHPSFLTATTTLTNIRLTRSSCTCIEFALKRTKNNKKRLFSEREAVVSGNHHPFFCNTAVYRRYRSASFEIKNPSHIFSASTIICNCRPRKNVAIEVVKPTLDGATPRL